MFLFSQCRQSVDISLLDARDASLGSIYLACCWFGSFAEELQVKYQQNQTRLNLEDAVLGTLLNEVVQ